MKQNVYIRTDGSADIGLGHVVRCMSLAHMLIDDFSIHFYVLEIPDSLKNEIIQIGWEITVLEGEADFLNNLTGNEIVVLDGYQFDSEYQKLIKSKECKLVCIDDFHDQHFYADLVINHAPGVTKEDYKGELYTKYLLGPDYALLRPEFLERSSDEKKKNLKEIENIFICFGGSDSKNLTAKVLSWLPSKNYIVTLVLGKVYPHQDELNKVIEEREDLEIIVRNSLSAKEMRSELEQADLAIVPASGIALEALSINIPLLSGYYANNQFSFYSWLKEKGLIFDSKNFGKDSFIIALNKIDYDKAYKQVENQSQIIDLKSGYRIKDEIRKIRG